MVRQGVHEDYQCVEHSNPTARVICLNSLLRPSLSWTAFPSIPVGSLSWNATAQRAAKRKTGFFDSIGQKLSQVRDSFLSSRLKTLVEGIAVGIEVMAR
jgi:hypothetical protein